VRGHKTNKMKIVIFKDKTWKEIPKQDNPTFDYIYENTRLQEGLIGRRTHCLLICKVLPYRSNGVGKNGYEVVEIPITGDIVTRGLFWHLEYAKLFAEALAKVKDELQK